MATARAGHTATFLPSGKVLVAGGAGEGAAQSSEIYDPVTGAWSATGSLAAARGGHTATLLPSGKVLVVGGGASAEVFDPETGTWSLTGSLQIGRSGHTATLLPSGKVLIVGGYGSSYLASAEMYDPATGTWSTAASLMTARTGHMAALLPSGRVLVAAGEGSGWKLDHSAEVYAPELGAWIPSAALSTERNYGASATLLASGKVLVVGGVKHDDLASYFDSELYDEARGAPVSNSPAVSEAPALIAAPGGSLTLQGTLLTGVSEGSGGGSQSSPANYPLVQIERQDNEWSVFARVTDFSSTSANVEIPPSLQPGWHWLRVIVNGVPSVARSLFITLPLTVAPASASSPPKGSLQFTASGGSGTGRTWTLATNASKGSIHPTSGAYSAGPTGGVTDVVQVTDSIGSVATSAVAVTAGVSISPAVTTVAPKGSLSFSATGGSGLGYLWSLSTNASGGSIDRNTGAYKAGAAGDVGDAIQVVDSLGNVATSNVAVTSAVSISPATTSLPPRASVSFTATGGSGGGYTWSLSAHASGGVIDAATGAYTAGPTGGVTDVVQVSDSLGNVATRSVSITAGISIAPATASLPPRASVAFSASGGAGAGYTWSLPTNASGAILDPSTGAYTAGATGGVTDVVQVADSLGNIATRSIAVTAGVGISPATATLAPRASLAFAASGGSGAGYSWSLSTHASGGAINGSTGAYTAGSTGGVTDVVQVTDSLGNTAAREISVTAGVSIAPAALSLPPRGSHTFAAAGGSGTGYAWTFAANGSGGSIDRATGAYMAGATGGVTDVIQVADSLGNTAIRSVTVTVGVRIAPDSVSAPPMGPASFVASGGSGIGYSWSFSSNASGGSIGASTGAYRAGPAGDVTDVIQVVDSLGNLATAKVTVGAGIGISPKSASLPPRASASFTATGGSGVGYSWSLSANASGGVVDAATGAYAAGPTGGVTDVVQVKDSLGNVATRSVSVTAGISIMPATASLPPRASVVFSALGGAGTGYSWSLSAHASGGVIDAATGAYTAGPTGGVTDVIQVADSLGNIAQRSVTITAGVSIAPSAAVVVRGGRLTFQAAGGSGSGYAWSLASAPSGGGIEASSGAYIAGAIGGVIDVVQVMDALGNVALRSVAVTEGVVIHPAETSVPPKGRLSLESSGGSGVGYTWSLAENRSGGSVDAATGAYTAGAMGGVADLVQLTDSVGNIATQRIAVTDGIQITPESMTVAPRSRTSLGASGGSGAGLVWSLPTNASGGSIDSETGLYAAGGKGGVKDVVQVADSLGNTAAIEITVTAGLSISPADASVAPRASVSFTASGGSGIDYQWSLATNASGGSIDPATGAYRAGAAGGTTDVVQVGDSLGNTATIEVSVTAGLSISPADASVAPRASVSFTASGGSGMDFHWSLATNASGGSIDPGTGFYTAGATGGTTDVVEVVDSLGNTAATSVKVESPRASQAVGCACGTTGDVPAQLAFGLAALVFRRRRKARL